MERRLPGAPIVPDALAITVEMIECGCSLLHCMSLLLAQSGHPDRLTRCPLLGVKRTLVSHSAMSALPPIADIRQRSGDVRFVPKADITLIPKTGSKASIET